ncbi:MAG: hypothetical protein JWP25_7134 [Bradyrhizobium sp.]|jgi:hypothetical protein|nr:hypothetical protein [Bradyrhizobium sp.]
MSGETALATSDAARADAVFSHFEADVRDLLCGGRVTVGESLLELVQNTLVDRRGHADLNDGLNNRGALIRFGHSSTDYSCTRNTLTDRRKRIANTTSGWFRKPMGSKPGADRENAQTLAYLGTLGTGSTRRLPLPIGVDHRRSDVGRIAKRRRAARSGISATTAASSAVSHCIIRTRARPAACVIFIATGCNDNRGDSGGGQCRLDLAFRSRRWIARVAGCRDCRGWLSYRPANGRRPDQHGRLSNEPNGLANHDGRRALVAQCIGPKRRDPQKNQYRSTSHAAIQSEAGSARKVCQGTITRSVRLNPMLLDGIWI